MGIADVWTGDAEDPEHWRETHLRIEGPAVRDILGGFLENWTEATRSCSGRHHVPELTHFDDGVDVQVPAARATAGGTAAAELFYAAIAGAQERLWLTTAYFAPGAAFVDLLGDAARRGVDVRILVNGPKSTRRWCGRPASAPTAGCSRRACASSSTNRRCCTPRC